MGYIKIYIIQCYNLIIIIHYNKNILFSYKLNKFKLNKLLFQDLVRMKLKLLIIYIINWLQN